MSYIQPQTSEQASNRNQSAVRAVLRNEITWIIFIPGSAWGIVMGVVLPIQALQIQVAAVQAQLQSERTTYDNMQQDLGVLKSQQAVTQSELDQHLKQTSK